MFSIASIATMAACIFLFGIFFSIVTNFRYMVQKAEEGVAITVFFDEEATDAQIREDRRRAEEARTAYLKVNFVSADEAWDSFQDEYFGDVQRTGRRI